MHSAHTTQNLSDTPKALLIAYNFPPINNGGVLRSKMFAKYWGRLGWDIHVLTTNICGDLPNQYEGARILRSTELRRIFNRLRQIKKTQRHKNSCDDTSLSPTNFSFANRVRKLYRKWILIPDVTITWAIFSFWKALIHIKKNPGTVVITTSPPESSHLIGLLLKLIYGCQWIMDLRDPWTFDPINEYLQKESARLSLDKKIERYCFLHADKIILNTPSTTARYQRLYPAYSFKTMTVTNGFDPEAIAEAKDPNILAPPWLRLLNSFYLISHIGTFGRHGSTNIVPDNLLRALRLMLDNGVLSTSKHRVIFAGQQNKATNDAIALYGLNELIVTPGMVPHSVALKIMDMSDILIVADPNDSGEFYVHGKLYEYLAMKKHIIGILPDGSSNKLLMKFGFKSITKSGDYKNLVRILSSTILGNNSIRRFEDNMIDQYSYEHIASQALDLDSFDEKDNLN